MQKKIIKREKDDFQKLEERPVILTWQVPFESYLIHIINNKKMSSQIDGIFYIHFLGAKSNKKKYFINGYSMAAR